MQEMNRKTTTEGLTPAPSDYPRLVGLVRNVVTVCLKEQGILS